LTNRRFPRVLVAAMALALGASALQAGTTDIIGDNGSPTGVRIVTPDTRSLCSDTPTNDTITITGVGGRQIKGVISMQYVTDAGREQVPGQLFSIDQTGDLTLTLTYPPVSYWPVLSGGTREIHVDIQIELYENGVKTATIGPGTDWDVFCIGDVPPPPPPSTFGCTPGFWKQRQHYSSWIGVAPTHKITAVFNVTPTFNSDLNLIGALSLQGGGESALLRHGVAAFLNASNTTVHYAYSKSQVILLVQQAYSTGAFEQIKNMFETQNEIGCPLR
jgi:hypothetical protein